MFSRRIIFIKKEEDILLKDDVKFVKIDCSNLFTKDAVFKTFSQKLNFSFVVDNWDGFNDFFWDADSDGKLPYHIKKLYIYIYNLENLLKKERKRDRFIFYSIINEDYNVNAGDEIGNLNFPADIYIYIPEKDKKFIIDTPVEVIYSSN